MEIILNRIKNTFKAVLFLAIVAVFAGCEEYLDKAPESSLVEEDIFKEFISFQGFVEELYTCVLDYPKADQNWQFADEVLYSNPFPFDLGNYWSQSNLLYGTGLTNTDENARNDRVWPMAWYGIRKANIAISKVDELIGTQEEKDLIKGQALFFRGWCHFELMRYWGGLPYIDTVLPAGEPLRIPRLNYRETALKAAEDFEEAAELLPLDWDDTEAGQATLGNNRQRINKIIALGYLGKDLLFAASPMMNEESTGVNAYDTELCRQAAEVFAEVINLCEQTGMYQLEPWETRTDVFWVDATRYQKISGGREVIMAPTLFNAQTKRASGHSVHGNLGSQFTRVLCPTQNYVKNYAMANGLPIDDPLSGYDPNDPWTNREPRFYKEIILDGEEICGTSSAGLDRYAQLYTGGRHRIGNGSPTGYLYKKWTPKGCNKWENFWNHIQFYLPFLRLADVYLMYAESTLQAYGTPQSMVQGCITAEEAVNIIRNRSLLPDLESRYTSSKEVFMEEIIRERAVELGFEGHRFHDLRRWNLNGEMKYREKTALEFERGADGKPINIYERVVITRAVEKKHNWVPFQVDFTKMYEEFPQNPGW
jgi:hypothetical protein